MATTEDPVLPDAAAAAMNDPWLTALTSALDGSQGVDPLALVRAQLEAQGDARAQLLLRLLDRQQQHRAVSARETEEDAASLADAEDPGASEVDVADGQVDLQEDVRNVQQAVDEIYAELEVLRARTAGLAAATGACAICFGEDPLCDRCLGRGAPGSRRPDPVAFRKYVLPAYRRARAIERARASGPAHRSDVHAQSTQTTTAAHER